MVSFGYSSAVWRVTPTRCLSSSGLRATSMPRTSSWPESGARRPSSISTVVVLPAPFGPSSPKTSPGATSKETPSTACTAP